MEWTQTTPTKIRAERRQLFVFGTQSVIESAGKAISAILNKPKRVLAIAVFAFLCLHTPAIFSGVSVDDFIFLSEIKDGQNLFDLYNFDRTLSAVKPWWAHERQKFVLFRPFTSLLLNLDYKLFGDQFNFWHIHSILWGLLLLSGCWHLFNITLPKKAAGLALIILACSCFTSWSVDYIAQRNHLISFAAGVWALFFYIKWRRRQLNSGRLITLACLSIGLLAGEYCLAIIVYLFAFEISNSKLNIKESLSNIWPVLLVLMGYMALLKLADAGTYGMPGYLHPATEPLAYLANLPARLISLAGYLFVLPVVLSKYNASVFHYGFLIVVLLIGIYCFRKMRTQQAEDNGYDIRAVYWYASGMMLSLLPIASTVPRMRLISCGALGFSALIGMLISYFLSGKNGRKSIWLMPYILYWVFFAFIYSPKMCFYTPKWLSTNHQTCISSYRYAEAHKTIDISRHTVVLRAPSYHGVLIIPKISQFHNNFPLGYSVLTATENPVNVNIIDNYAMEITSVKGSLFDAYIGRFFRSSEPENRFKKSDLVTNELFSAEIVRLEDGFPTKIRFTFKIPINSPKIQFVSWEDDRLVAFNLSETGNEAIFIEPYTAGTLW